MRGRSPKQSRGEGPHRIASPAEGRFSLFRGNVIYVQSLKDGFISGILPNGPLTHNLTTVNNLSKKKSPRIAP
ncbi:MAG: hypothetical protein LBT00_06805 [Spirochaetaceae bacterium]|nr:hypothetical protein [Spirochaetaceae bacterium]